MVITGRARFMIDGAEHDAPAGTLVFIPDPRSRRSATAVEDGTVALAVGGRAGQPYEVSPWEASFAAKGLADAGDHDGAVELMTEALLDHPKNPHVLYNAACYEAVAGRREDALKHLHAAAALAPEVLEWASRDPDFDEIRDDPEFPAYPLASLITTRIDMTPNSPAAHSSTSRRIPRIFSGSGRKRRLMTISRIGRTTGQRSAVIVSAFVRGGSSATELIGAAGAWLYYMHRRAPGRHRGDVIDLVAAGRSRPATKA